MAFTASIFTNLTNAKQDYKLWSDCSRNMNSRGRNSFMAISKTLLSPSQFSRNSCLLNILYENSIPNFKKI